MYRLFESDSDKEVDHNTYSAIYKLEGEEIILESCSDGYKYIYGLTGNVFGISISRFLKPEFSRSIKGIIKNNNRSALRFMHEFEGEFWRATLKVNTPFCECTGERIKSSELYGDILGTGERLNVTDPAASIMLCKESDAFIVESLCESAMNQFGLSVKTDIRKGFIDRLSYTEGIDLLCECLKNNRSIKFTEEFWNKNRHHFLLIAAVPLKHGNIERLLLVVRIIERCEYYKLLKKSVTHYPPDIYPSLCAIWYDYNQCCMQHSNQKFYDLFCSREEKCLDAIFSSAVMKNAVATGSPSFGKLNIPNPKGESDYYFCCVIPIPNQQSVLLLLSSEGENNCALIKISKKLTKREGQILDFVVLGNKNTYIAKVLGVKEGTVKKIISNIYKKLDVSSRVELIRLIYFYDEGKKSS